MAQIRYEIPDNVHRALKAEAARRGIALKELIVLVLTEATTRRAHNGGAR
jgi:predicted HicB family RNase H-like nuclease